MIRLAAQAIQRGASQQWRAAAARSRDAGGCCCSSSGAARSERGSSGGKGLVDRAVAAGAGLLGAALAVHGAQDALESGSSHAWPVADATVLDSKIEEVRSRMQRDDRSNTSLSFRFRDAQGREHEGSFQGVLSRQDAEQLRARLAASRAVPIAFDPQNPGRTRARFAGEGCQACAWVRAGTGLALVAYALVISL